MAPDQKNYLKQAKRKLVGAGLVDEFRYHGSVDRSQKIEFLRNLDLFSVPTTYVEPKGLFLLEAMACGVPVVQPDHGAFREMITKTGGGLFFPPVDPGSLADILYGLWKEPALREHLGQNGFDGVRQYYGIARSADRMLEVYESSRSGAGHKSC
jgi:glycosyltransferase involved in cell wall biosynthesis